MIKQNKYEAIVIGGSLGGMDAVIKILSCLPSNINIAIIVVLHRLKSGKSPLIEIVSGKTKVCVKEADEKEPVLPGCVYFAPADYHLLVEPDKYLALDASERVNFSRPSIDVTFESAAYVYKEKLVGVILTGANSDGSCGLKKVKEYGGMTIVQDPDDAVCSVMPKAAIGATDVDKVLPLNEVCNYIVGIAQAY